MLMNRDMAPPEAGAFSDGVEPRKLSGGPLYDVDEDAEVEAEYMNADRSKFGFFMQVSGNSELSGVSTTYSLEELSSPEFFSRQCTEIDAMASRVVDESSIKEAFQSAVKEGEFCVTIGDPRSHDIPLIAVSDKFEKITGYCRSEVLGKNCRFLNSGCLIDAQDLLNLRTACEGGAAFTAVLTNRRKSGDFFLNLLDLRGLTVAQNPYTGEDLWFLVAIQADVTHLGADDVQMDKCHLAEMHEISQEMHEIANGIRAKLADELSAMAVAGALMTNFTVAHESSGVGPSPDAWCLLPVPVWREAELCQTQPHLFGMPVLRNKPDSGKPTGTDDRGIASKLFGFPSAQLAAVSALTAVAATVVLSQQLRRRSRLV